MRIAFVIQRYGKEVSGGAELHCRLLASRISKIHRVEVLTTCAKNYLTWENEFDPGSFQEDGVVIRRFKVDGFRDKLAFDSYSNWLFSHPHSLANELEWINMQGPLSSDLLGFIEKNKKEFDLFIFYTYLYAPTYYGLHICPEKSILVCCAHNELPIYLSIFKPMFNLPCGIIYLTEAEKKLVDGIFHLENKPNVVLGVGIEPPSVIDAKVPANIYHLENYICTGGRLEPGKGCLELIEFFLRAKDALPDDVKLVLFGYLAMDLPNVEKVKYLGFIDENSRWAIMASSLVVISPSPLESLSLLTLEGMALGKPVLVNGRCEVSKEHILKSNGGLFYTDFFEFKEMLELLVKNRDFARILGENGKKYVRENYNWDRLDERFQNFIKQIKLP